MCFQFGLYLSVNLSEPQGPNLFTEMYRHQQATSENVEKEEGANESSKIILLFLHVLISTRYSNRNGERQEDT